MSDKIYPKGIIAFKPKEGAKEWVKGTIIINLADFKEWVNSKEGIAALTEYKGAKQLKLQITENRNGAYGIAVDNWKPKEKEENWNAAPKQEIENKATINNNQDDSDDLPF